MKVMPNRITIAELGNMLDHKVVKAVDIKCYCGSVIHIPESVISEHSEQELTYVIDCVNDMMDSMEEAIQRFYGNNPAHRLLADELKQIRDKHMKAQLRVVK